MSGTELVPYEEDKNISRPLVLAYVPGLHYLKSFLNVWKSLSEVFNFTADSNGISALGKDPTNRIYISLIIHGDELINYEFNLDEGDEVKALVSSKEFESRLRCKKNSHGTMIIHSGSNNIYLSKEETSEGSSNEGSLVTLRPPEDRSYTLPNYDGYMITKVLTSKLVSIFKKGDQVGVDSVRFTPFKDGIRVSTHNKLNKLIDFANCGPCEESYNFEQSFPNIPLDLRSINLNTALVPASTNFKIVESPYSNSFYISIEAKTIKSLNKLASASCESSVIKIYYRPGDPIMLEGGVGTFGKYRIYIR